MDLELAGKRIFITGGSKGIGLACVDAFLAEGAKVAICSRSKENLDRAKATRPSLYCVAADLIDGAAAAAAIDEIESKFGAIDVLVNSAGAAKRVSADDLTPAFWRDAMDAKFFSYINVIDPMIKRMAARGNGVIVNVIGVGGKVASAIHLAGGSANAALMLATAGLGSAYASKGVRVVGVSPGLTETERVAEGLAAEVKRSNITMEQARQKAVAKLPLGRMATPDEVAAAVVYLSSPKAGYVTGTTLSIDGGMNPVVL